MNTPVNEMVNDLIDFSPEELQAMEKSFKELKEEEKQEPSSEVNDLTNEEKIRLIRAGKYDIELFIKENERMIWKVMTRYKQGKTIVKEDEQDFYSMGLGGLYRAICDYDETRGAKFSTVAWWYILTELQRHYREIYPHNHCNKYAICLSETEYDFIEGNLFISEKYNWNFDGIKMTDKQKQWFYAYLELRNFSKVAERFGVSKQVVRESVRRTQAKLRQKYY